MNYPVQPHDYVVVHIHCIMTDKFMIHQKLKAFTLSDMLVWSKVSPSMVVMICNTSMNLRIALASKRLSPPKYLWLYVMASIHELIGGVACLLTVAKLALSLLMPGR
jgi:hypothetical protein